MKYLKNLYFILCFTEAYHLSAKMRFINVTVFHSSVGMITPLSSPPSVGFSTQMTCL